MTVVGEIKAARFGGRGADVDGGVANSDPNAIPNPAYSRRAAEGAASKTRVHRRDIR